MKFLLVGDIHIRLDNFDEIDLLLEQICTHLQEHPDASLVLLGDILHSFEKVFTPCLNKACEFIQTCSKYAKTYVLVGNHDYVNQYQFQTDQHWMNPLKCWGEQVVIVDKVICVEGHVLMCPYVSTGRLTEALDSSEMNWKEDISLVFCHQEVRGCKMGMYVSEHGDVWEETFPQLISGHIHETQKIGKNVYYPGSPLQHSFSDFQQKRLICLVEYVPMQKLIKTMEIVLSVPRKQIIRTTLTTGGSVSSLSQVAKGDKTKLILKDVSAEQFKLFKKTDEYKKLVDSGVQIQIQPKAIQNTKTNPNGAYGTFKDILRDLSSKEDELVMNLFQRYIN